jgi:TonB family protein
VLFACSTQPANEQSPESENASVINGKEQLPDSLRPQVVLVGNPYKEGVVQPTFPEGSEKLMALLNQEVEFPSAALENNTRGYVYAQFTIEKDGSVDNGTIKKSLSKECDEEVLRIIRMMPDWTPGTENGKPIAIDNKLYVNFNMKRDVTDPNKVVKDQLSGQDSIFTVVKHMPEFPGGIESLMNYLATNITYPEQARKANLEGRVFINFIVEKDGSVSSVNVLRGIGGGCDKEAVRVVENMPAWKPGRNEAGEPVRVSYNIPIKFTLSEKK